MVVAVAEVAVAGVVGQRRERTCWVWIVEVVVAVDRNNHRKHHDYPDHMH